MALFLSSNAWVPRLSPISDLWQILSILGDSLTDCWPKDKCHSMWGSKSRLEIPKSSMQEDTQGIVHTETTRGTKLGQNESESVEVKPKGCYKLLRALFKTFGVWPSREDIQVLHMHTQRHCYCVNVPQGTLWGTDGKEVVWTFQELTTGERSFPCRSGSFLTWSLQLCSQNLSCIRDRGLVNKSKTEKRNTKSLKQKMEELEPKPDESSSEESFESPPKEKPSPGMGRRVQHLLQG